MTNKFYKDYKELFAKCEAYLEYWRPIAYSNNKCYFYAFDMLTENNIILYYYIVDNDNNKEYQNMTIGVENLK